MDQWTSSNPSGRKYRCLFSKNTKIIPQNKAAMYSCTGTMDPNKISSFQSGLSFRKKNFIRTVEKFLLLFVSLLGSIGCDFKIREGRRVSKVNFEVPQGKSGVWHSGLSTWVDDPCSVEASDGRSPPQSPEVPAFPVSDWNSSLELLDLPLRLKEVPSKSAGASLLF